MKPYNRILAPTLSILLCSACGVTGEPLSPMTPEPSGIVAGGFGMSPLPKPRTPVQLTSNRFRND